MLPLDVGVLAPERMLTAPPAAEAAIWLPAASIIAPPEPVSDEPTMTDTLPTEASLTELPMLTKPVAAPAAVPELNTRVPLELLPTIAFPDRIVTPPEALGPRPLTTNTTPPSFALPATVFLPLLSSSLPPLPLVVLPTVRETEPAAPPVAAPVTIDSKPASPDELSPLTAVMEPVVPEAVLEREVRNTEPVPADDVPDATSSVPEALDKDSPLRTDTLPLLPALVVPELNTIVPVAPANAAFSVRTHSTPELPLVPVDGPEAAVTAPPVDAAVVPALEPLDKNM